VGYRHKTPSVVHHLLSSPPFPVPAIPSFLPALSENQSFYDTIYLYCGMCHGVMMDNTLASESFSATVEAISDEGSVPSYQCSHCQRQFTRLDHLSRHVRTRRDFFMSPLTGS
jgi:hypothetical protein